GRELPDPPRRSPTGSASLLRRRRYRPRRRAALMPRSSQTVTPRPGRPRALAALLVALPLLPALPGCVPRVDERARAYAEDGVSRFQAGRYRDAGESFEAALERQPGEANLLYNVGQCYDRQGAPAKAQEFYQLCLQRAENHAACRHALAVLLLRTGRRGEAE